MTVIVIWYNAEIVGSLGELAETSHVYSPRMAALGIVANSRLVGAVAESNVRMSTPLL